MYIDSISKKVSAKPTASATQTSTPKMVAAPDTTSIASVESTEGSTQQAHENPAFAYTGTDARTQNTSSARAEARISEEKQALEQEKIKKAIEKMNVQLQNSEVKFGIHEKTDRVTIKFVDKETKEVIKEFPPEKTLDMIAKCMELAGVLVDERL